MKKYYRDFYGNTASISKTNDSRFRLKVRVSNGQLVHNKVYDTERGAKIALGRSSDGWKELKAS